ncbi:MAG: hypothetical protein BA872_09995 [Desulfobacterales bacterium C00003060]|nr:MAG: hypothetical protein BA872_09995 [Desulfobacterales bacterium C00003060]OEU79814.1 MAG: hypothetical protein BA865_06430 [Desulfobacterales bacterium S5133MH4]
MKTHTQAQLAPEVQQLARLLDDAAKSLPDIWAAIQKSVTVAEFTCNYTVPQNREGIEISAGTETSMISKVKELS